MNRKKNKKVVRINESQVRQIVAESVKRVINEARFSKYNYSKNPLFTSDEAKYWDTLEFPDDVSYQKMKNVLLDKGDHYLYTKFGHDAYNAFMLRLQEDEPEIYEQYVYGPLTDTLPF